MALHDYVIDNAAGAVVRGDLNDALAAIASLNSSASDPASTSPYNFSVAYMLWPDTTNGLLKQRNAANSAWITLFELGVDYPGFESGTNMLCGNTSGTAPTGWTKSTTHNNKAIRIVSGTPSSGGSYDFTTAFANGNTGNHALAQNELPSYYLTVNDPGHAHYVGASGHGAGVNVGYISPTGYDLQTRSATTGISVHSGGSGANHNHSLSLSVKYVDVFAMTKDAA